LRCGGVSDGTLPRRTGSTNFVKALDVDDVLVDVETELAGQLSSGDTAAAGTRDERHGDRYPLLMRRE